MRGSLSSPIFVLSLDVDAEALQEALVALDVDRHALGAEVEHGDLRVLAVLVELRLGPLADQLAGLVVVGRERRVGGVRRLGLRVERDDEQPGLTRLVERRHDRLRVVRRDHEALGAGRDQALDRRHLALVVAVLLAGERLQRRRRAPWPSASAPSFIFTKNGLVSVLVMSPTLTSPPPPPRCRCCCCRCRRRRTRPRRRPAPASSSGGDHGRVASAFASTFIALTPSSEYLRALWVRENVYRAMDLPPTSRLVK